MNILAISPAADPAVRSGATVTANAGGDDFARHLEQAAAAPATADDRSASQPAAAQQASEPAAARPDTAATTADLPPPVEEQATLQQTHAASLSVLPNAAQGSAVQLPDDALGEVRRRLLLIEQAGQLADTAAASGLPAVPLAQPPQPAALLQPVNAGEAPAPPEALAGLLDQLGIRPGAAARGDDAQPQSADQPAAPAAATAGLAPLAEASTAPQPVEVPAEAGVKVAPPGHGEAFSAAPLGQPAPAPNVAPTGSAPAPGVATLSAPLASREWRQDLGQQLIGLHQRGEQQVDLHLHPAELGPLSISLKLGENGAQAQFLSAHPQVRAAVEQALPQLREALASQGIALGEASVGEQRQPPRDGQPGASDGPRRLDARVDGMDGEQRGSVSSQRVLPLGRGAGVDLYA